MSEELKPCPFCGSKNVMIDDLFDNGTNTVFCGECQSKSSNFCHFDSAIEQWNTRAPQNEWISVDDEDPNPSSYHHVLDASGSVRICLVIDYKSFGLKDNCWQDLDLNDVDMKGTMFIEIVTPTPPKEI
jgi:Lar family restriction alleviation protein